MTYEKDAESTSVHKATATAYGKARVARGANTEILHSEKDRGARDAKIIWGRHTHNHILNLKNDGVILESKAGVSLQHIKALTHT